MFVIITRFSSEINSFFRSLKSKKWNKDINITLIKRGHSMKPILFLLTGGTIGSTVEKGIIRTDAFSCEAIELYCKRYGKTDSFEIVPLMNILSENLQKKHWETLINYLRQINLSNYSGVIITHGSDTLSYSSAFAGLCLHGMACPVILTAADRVPQHPESNAVDNLRAAVILLKNVQQGVYTVYRNPGDRFCSVWLSTRIQEADRILGRFSSIDGRTLCRIEQDRLTITHETLWAAVCQKTFPLFLPESLRLPFDILMIQPYPGMDYRCFVLSDTCRAVLHLTYHSSSASVQTNNSALSFLQLCQQKKVPFYLLSLPRERNNLYETSHCLLQNGAIPLYHCTRESAYAKLLLSVNISSLPEDFIFRNQFLEFL